MRALIDGVLAVLPIYLATLLLLRAMKSLAKLARPLAHLAPKWFPAETVFSFLFVLVLCLLVGIVLCTPIGQAARARMENSILRKIPGYTLFRGMVRQLAGEDQESSWRPALAEIEEALVPAFIIEELDDGRFTVFVPAAPTPMTGSIYILTPDRVHPLHVPFAHAVKAITRCGSGSKELVAAMRDSRAPYIITK